MSKGSVCSFAVFVGFIITSTPASAQFSRGQDFKVELRGQPEDGGGEYSLRLVDTVHRQEFGQADADAFGLAAFRAIPAGEYLLQVRNASGDLLREEFVRIGNGNQSVVQISLPAQPKRLRPTGERVSVRQLRNPPSKSAFQAFVAAQRYSEAGQNDKAAAALEKAIRLSPDYAEAYTNLGAQHLKLGQYEKALQYAERAMEIGSPNILDLSNRGLALWALGRQEEAMQSARQAIRLDSGRAMTAHYIAGSLLALDAATRDEGVRHLEIAAEKLPAAAKNLAKVRRSMAGM